MKKIPFDEDFFCKDNERSFYWAGVIAADGNIKICNRKYKNIVHRYSVNLSLIEKDMIEQFLADIKCVGRKIQDISYKKENGVGHLYVIDLSSQQMFNDLHRFGITPKKSLTLEMPEWLESHPLVNHFIRGYFDGDGTIFVNNNNKNLSFAGTENFLNKIHNIIKDKAEITTKGKVRPHSNIYVVTYAGNKLVPKVGDFLYKDATIWLERKRVKIMA